MEKRRGTHIISDSRNQCWFGPLVGTQAALSQAKCECLVIPPDCEARPEPRSVSVRGATQQNSGPVERSGQNTQQWIWGTDYSLKQLSEESRIKDQSECPRKEGWSSLPPVKRRHCFFHLWYGSGLEICTWASRPDGTGNQTSGLVGTGAKALPSKSWLCRKMIEPSRAGIIFIYLLKFSPTWGGDKGAPVTQAELRYWKERKCLPPLLQAMGTTPHTSVFKPSWLELDTPV